MRKTLIFSKEEFQRWIRKTKEMMDKGGMEMLLLMDTAGRFIYIKASLSPWR
ncbi:MAG: hypothetical protein JSU83_00960 [Deltaproteobacteria bacterium]|nr:MAG: hypothetical protein JSU83_00960 [Deltaproteobacteria bacterium]